MTILYIIPLVALLVFIFIKLLKPKSLQTQKTALPKQSKADNVTNPKLDRQNLISRKTGLPYHPMLEYFVPGIRITPAHGDERPSREIISDFENQIDWKFPKPYIDFQLKYGAVFMQVDESIWPEAKVGDVSPVWATNYGFIIYGFSKDCPDWLDIKRKHAQFKDQFPDLPFFIPIHRLVAGDQTYIGFDITGNLVTALQHENKLEPIKMDFDSFVASEAADLKGRMQLRIKYNETGEWPYYTL